MPKTDVKRVASLLREYPQRKSRVAAAGPHHGVAVEINAHPWRLDLDWRWHQKALDYGCIFSINPDAHSIREFDHIEMARKGGVPSDRVLAMALAKTSCPSGKAKARFREKTMRSRAAVRAAVGR